MVNTFITSTNLKKCAENLDWKRLGKQRVEAKQIIEAIEQPGKSSWENHPACKMWRDHVDALKVYFNHMVREWIARGYKNTLPFYDVNESEFEMIESSFDGKVTTFKEIETTNTTASAPIASVKTVTPASSRRPTKKRKRGGGGMGDEEAGEGETVEVKKEEVITTTTTTNTTATTTRKTFPRWFAWEPMIYAHRAALIRKYPEHYEPLFLEAKVIPYLERGYLWPTHLPESAFTAFDPSFFAEVASGAPSHYRIPIQSVKEWLKDPTVNPKTGRTISTSGGLYKDYRKAYEHYIAKGIISPDTILKQKEEEVGEDEQEVEETKETVRRTRRRK